MRKFGPARAERNLLRLFRAQSNLGEAKKPSRNDAYKKKRASDPQGGAEARV